MHPILFVQVYLFLVLPTSFLISYEYYNLGWNSMFIAQHTLYTSTDREGSGYMQLLLLSISRYVVFGICNVYHKWFQII